MIGAEGTGRQVDVRFPGGPSAPWGTAIFLAAGTATKLADRLTFSTVASPTRSSEWRGDLKEHDGSFTRLLIARYKEGKRDFAKVCLRMSSDALMKNVITVTATHSLL